MAIQVFDNGICEGLNEKIPICAHIDSISIVSDKLL